MLAGVRRRERPAEERSPKRGRSARVPDLFGAACGTLSHRMVRERVLKGLSIRQPWAEAIMHHGKRVENRTFYTTYRGPILIHVSKSGTHAEFAEAARWMTDRR